MDLESLNKKVIPDPLTGDFQTVYWNDEGTYLLCMPHKCTPLPEGVTLKDEYKWTDNKDGTKTWEIIYGNQTK